jgi:hypothetical protein
MPFCRSVSEGTEAITAIEMNICGEGAAAAGLPVRQL